MMNMSIAHSLTNPIYLRSICDYLSTPALVAISGVCQSVYQLATKKNASVSLSSSSSSSPSSESSINSESNKRIKHHDDGNAVECDEDGRQMSTVSPSCFWFWNRSQIYRDHNWNLGFELDFEEDDFDCTSHTSLITEDMFCEYKVFQPTILRYIMHLSLHGNCTLYGQYHDTGLLPGIFNILIQLLVLDLSGCDWITNEWAVGVFKKANILASLQSLNISYCALAFHKSQGGTELILAIQQLKSLKHLMIGPSKKSLNVTPNELALIFNVNIRSETSSPLAIALPHVSSLYYGLSSDAVKEMIQRYPQLSVNFGAILHLQISGFFFLEDPNSYQKRSVSDMITHWSQLALSFPNLHSLHLHDPNETASGWERLWYRRHATVAYVVFIQSLPSLVSLQLTRMYIHGSLQHFYHFIQLLCISDLEEAERYGLSQLFNNATIKTHSFLSTRLTHFSLSFYSYSHRELLPQMQTDSRGYPVDNVVQFPVFPLPVLHSCKRLKALCIEMADLRYKDNSQTPLHSSATECVGLAEWYLPDDTKDPFVPWTTIELDGNLWPDLLKALPELRYVEFNSCIIDTVQTEQCLSQRLQQEASTAERVALPHLDFDITVVERVHPNDSFGLGPYGIFSRPTPTSVPSNHLQHFSPTLPALVLKLIDNAKEYEPSSIQDISPFKERREHTAYWSCAWIRMKEDFNDYRKLIHRYRTYINNNTITRLIQQQQHQQQEQQQQQQPQQPPPSEESESIDLCAEVITGCWSNRNDAFSLTGMKHLDQLNRWQSVG